MPLMSQIKKIMSKNKSFRVTKKNKIVEIRKSENKLKKSKKWYPITLKRNLWKNILKIHNSKYKQRKKLLKDKQKNNKKQLKLIWNNKISKLRKRL